MSQGGQQRTAEGREPWWVALRAPPPPPHFSLLTCQWEGQATGCPVLGVHIGVHIEGSPKLNCRLWGTTATCPSPAPSLRWGRAQGAQSHILSLVSTWG